MKRICYTIIILVAVLQIFWAARASMDVTLRETLLRSEFPQSRSEFDKKCQTLVAPISRCFAIPIYSALIFLAMGATLYICDRKMKNIQKSSNPALQPTPTRDYVAGGRG